MSHYYKSFLLLMCTIFAAQSLARGPDDVVDMRAREGERELEDRGFRHQRTIDVKESTIAYWWKARDNRCIAVTTKNGYIRSVADQPESVCDARDSGSGAHHGDHRSGDPDDLVGMRTSRGERELEDMGYRHRYMIENDRSTISYWWKPRGEHCIAVTTRNGEFTSVVEQPEAVCERRSDSHQGSRHRDGVGSEAPPGGFGAPDDDDAPPEIIMGTNGEGEVIFGSSRCVVYYDRRGRRTNSLPDCSHNQTRHADRAMEAHRREQGL